MGLSGGIAVSAYAGQIDPQAMLAAGQLRGS